MQVTVPLIGLRVEQVSSKAPIGQSDIKSRNY